MWRFAAPWAFIWCKAICLPDPVYAPLAGQAWRCPLPTKACPWQRVDRFCITDVIESPPAFDIQAPLTLVRQAFRESPELPWCMLTDGGRPRGRVAPWACAGAAHPRTVAQGAQPLQRMLPFNMGLTALARSLYLERMEDARPGRWWMSAAATSARWSR